MKKFLLFFTATALAALPLCADDDTNNAPPPGPPGGHHHGMNFLTAAQKAELKKAHDDAIAADPSLATEEKQIRDQMKANRDAGTPPTQEEMEAGKAFHEKMDAAMIKADPDVAPILEEIKKHHPHGPPPPPPPPTETDTSTSP